MTTQTQTNNNNKLEKRVSVTMTNKGHHSKQMEEMKEQNALVKYLNQKTSKRSLLCCKRLHIVHLVILFFLHCRCCRSRSNSKTITYFRSVYSRELFIKHSKADEHIGVSRRGIRIHLFIILSKNYIIVIFLSPVLSRENLYKQSE